MPAITQPTHNQVPIQIENDTPAQSAEEMTYDYQSKPDVVITGFGSFGVIVINPSFQIAQTLPSSLKSDDGYNIHIARHPEAIHVGWQSVVQFIPKLYDRHVIRRGQEGSPEGDIPTAPFFIHIGAGRPGIYHLETVAHRDGYWRQDVDGKAAPERPKCRGRGYPCEGDEDPLSPRELKTGINVTGVVTDVRSEVKDLSLPIDTSSDAGNYLCDFTFYTSLREARLRYGESGLQKVLFVHVPPDGKLEEGIRVLSAVIRSIVKRGKAGSSNS